MREWSHEQSIEVFPGRSNRGPKRTVIGGATITPHHLYWQSGASDAEREVHYRDLFAGSMELELNQQIRAATNGNYALGNDRFAEQISQAVGRRVVRGKAGRPRAVVDVDTSDLFDRARPAE